MSRKSKPPVICPYCQTDAALVTGREIYPHRKDLADKYFHRCRACDAWVGCHPGTSAPLGRLADKTLRAWKSAAHAAFDPLWRRKMEKQGITKAAARSAGYAWLAEQLQIAPADCHIGMFDDGMCKRVVEVCKRFHGGGR